jgi:hypothetical protein
MKKKIIVYLRGGIGNQLFMYATARALALDNDSELVVDNWTGFIRDKIYKRKFQLNDFQIQARLTSKLEILLFLLYRLNKRIFKIKPKFTKNYFGIQILTETDDTKYLPELKDINLQNYNWLDGLWQSPKYFENHKKLLYKELMPPKPISEKFLKVGEKMISEESVAIGIRLYEEEPEEILATNSKINKSSEINNAINKIKKKIPNANFYIFCTKNNKFLDELELPKNTKRITAENGFADAVNTLWLLSRCKHHVITSSTFYWWGAWLSSKFHQANKQIIYSDNLENHDGLPKDWNKFFI